MNNQHKPRLTLSLPQIGDDWKGEKYLKVTPAKQATGSAAKRLGYNLLHRQRPLGSKPASWRSDLEEL